MKTPGKGEDHAVASPGWRSGVLGELSRFVETTSVKGLKRVVLAHNGVLRALWLLAVGVGLGMALYIVAVLCIRYSHYSTVTSVQEVTGRSAFPDITVCPLQPLSQPLVHRHLQRKFFARMDALIGDTSPHRKRTVAEQARRLNMSEGNVMEIFKQVATPGGLFESLYFSEEAVTAGFASMQLILPATQLKGWNWDLLLQTQLQATDLHRLAIRPHTNVFHYMCQTIELPPGNATELPPSLLIPVRSTTLLLYADPRPTPPLPFYTPDLFQSRSHGVKVVVHERGTVPDLKAGFNLAPGNEATVKLHPIQHSRMEAPYGHCTRTSLIAGVAYTQGLCRDLARQNFIVKTCGCFVGYLLFTEDMYWSGTPMCANFTAVITGNIHDEKPVADFINKTSCAIRGLNTELFDDMDCLPRCDSIEFRQTITHASWPHSSQLFPFYKDIVNNSAINRYADLFREKYDNLMQRYAGITKELNRLYNKLNWEAIPQELVENKYVNPNINQELEALAVNEDIERVGLIQKSFMQLNVLYESETVMQLKEQPELTWEGLLATIGGALNLWIGVTFMTLIELIELCCRLGWVVKKPTKQALYHPASVSGGGGAGMEPTNT